MVSPPPRTPEMMKAYKKQGGGRRNGSILITYLLGALLIALAPVLSIYAHSKHLSLIHIFPQSEQARLQSPNPHAAMAAETPAGN